VSKYRVLDDESCSDRYSALLSMNDIDVASMCARECSSIHIIIARSISRGAKRRAERNDAVQFLIVRLSALRGRNSIDIPY